MQVGNGWQTPFWQFAEQHCALLLQVVPLPLQAATQVLFTHRLEQHMLLSPHALPTGKQPGWPHSPPWQLLEQHSALVAHACAFAVQPLPRQTPLLQLRPAQHAWFGPQG